MRGRAIITTDRNLSPPIDHGAVQGALTHSALALRLRRTVEGALHSGKHPSVFVTSPETPTAARVHLLTLVMKASERVHRPGDVILQAPAGWVSASRELTLVPRSSRVMIGAAARPDAAQSAAAAAPPGVCSAGAKPLCPAPVGSV